jgi:hypothetical protein
MMLKYEDSRIEMEEYSLWESNPFTQDVFLEGFF